MDIKINALVARQQIAERITPPRSVPRQRRRTNISDKLRRVTHRLDNRLGQERIATPRRQ